MRYVIAMMLALAIPTAAYAQSATASAVGRYIIVPSPIAGKLTFLLDTATGKTWQLASIADLEGTPDAWKPMARIDNQEERNWLERTHSPLPNPAK